MITAFITGVVVSIPTSLITMKLLNSSLFISNTELREANAKISLIINNLDVQRREITGQDGKTRNYGQT